MSAIELQTIVADSPESKRLWDALAEGRLELQRCEHCRRLRFPPIASCPYCSTPGGTWETVEARGHLYSWVVTHVPFDPSLADEVPYTVATVVLDAGPRMFARLTDVEPDEIRAEMELEGYPHVEDGLPYLRFRPTASDD
jgi:uncharacterized OB-fold protein